MLRLCTEEVMSLKGVEEEEEGEGEDPEGEGTGSTELSDIRLLGRCGRDRWVMTELHKQTDDGRYIIDQQQLSYMEDSF